MPLDVKIVEGLLPYEDGVEMQRSLHDARREGRVGDTLLIVEHPSVFTLGRSASLSNLLWSADEVARRGAVVVECDRGGDITYHGPGQLVAYPIINLVARGMGVAEYVGALEDAMIATLRDFGLNGERSELGRGVWVSGSKIGFVGIRVSRRVTLHGISLNVCPDLSFFDGIVPCGIAGCKITSMEREKGAPVDISAVRRSLVQAFSLQFA